MRVLGVHIPGVGLSFNLWPDVFKQENELTIVYKQKSNRLIYVDFLISSLEQVGSKASFNWENLEVNPEVMTNRIENKFNLVWASLTPLL